MRLRGTAACIALAAVSAFANPVTPPKNLRPPVVIPVMGLQAKVDDGRVILTWRRYKRDDFKSYQLVKSADPNPMYPDVPALYWAEYADGTRYEDGRLEPGTFHYRVCIITKFGDRWVSPAVEVVIKPEDVKRAPPTEADFE
jgi:hypothetical protein